MAQHRVLIVGGGVIGRAIAWQLAVSGHAVTLVHDGKAGASAAAAGMLAPSPEALHSRADHALIAKLTAALALWDGFADRLQSASALAIDYHRSGIVVLDQDVIGGAPCAVPNGFRAMSAQRVAGEGQVDPRLLLAALDTACARAGVKTITATADDILMDGSSARGLRLLGGDTIAADSVIVAGGISSPGLTDIVPPLRPMRGRAYLIRMPRGFPQSVIRTPHVYFCPKTDGTLYVGATEEGTGQDDALVALWDAAITLYPRLAAERALSHFDGVRPVSPTGVPIIGLAPGTENVVLAIGHDRNGILLTPWTADQVTALVGAMAR